MASKLLLTIYVTIFLTKLAAGNVLFHLNYGLGIKDGYLDVGFDNSIKIKSNALTTNNDNNNKNSDEQLVFTTEAPSITPKSDEAKSDGPIFDTVLQTHLTATRDAMFNLQQELQPLVERSVDINAKVKIITRYLNVVDDALAPTNTDKFSKMQVLLRFPDYLDQLERITAGERSLEHIVMKLLLTKHGLYEQKRAVLEDLRHLDPESLAENLI